MTEAFLYLLLDGELMTTRCGFAGAVRRYPDLGEMKADEYRYWRRRPDHEHLAAVSELARDAYGEEAGSPHVPRLQRPFVRIERQ